MQNQTMTQFLAAIELKGKANTAFEAALRENSCDGRAHYLAVMGCHHMATQIMTQQQADLELEQLQWHNDSDFEEWYGMFEEACNAYDDLVDDDGRSLKMLDRPRLNKLVSKFKASEKPKDPQDRHWTRMIDQLELFSRGLDKPLTLGVLHQQILSLTQGTGNKDNFRGRSQAQINRENADRRINSTTKKKKKQLCFNWIQSGSCHRGDSCRFSHEDQQNGWTVRKIGEKTGDTQSEAGEQPKDEEQRLDRMISELMAMKTAQIKGRMALQAEHPYMHGRSVEDGGTGTMFTQHVAGGMVGPGIYQSNQGRLGMAQHFKDAEGNPAYYDAWKDS